MKIIEEIKFIIVKEWKNGFMIIKKIINLFRYIDLNNKILNEKPDIYLFNSDQRKNLIFQKNIYRIGVEMSYKYFYDSNINLSKEKII